MDEGTKNSPCKECEGSADEAQLRAEVDHLREHLAERDGHLVALEAEFVKCTSRVNDLEEQVDTWREKYERLYDSHKRVQKLNQVLEDKLLQMVDKMKGEKSQLTKDIATLSVRLAESKYNYSMLQKENERYKNDMNLAIQLLQCKPDNFVAQKLDNLPVDTQARVSQYVMSKTSKPSSSNHSKNGNGNEHDTFDASEYEFNISASLMTKILEDSIQDSMTKHCDSCTCTKTQTKPFCYNEGYFSVGTQTILSGEMKNSLCLNCNSEIKSVKSNLSARSTSPHGIKLINDKNLGLTGPLYIMPQPIKEQDNGPEIVCEKINISDSDKLVEENKVEILKEIPRKEEDLRQIKKNNTVNMEPTVHHKLCDRTKTSTCSKLSSNHSVAHEEALIKDNIKDILIKNDNHPKETVSVRKNSLSSMGAVSRTSSIAKSTVSTHKSSSHVGPGPRFCHLRMQAGSKNILLDNAEPDVPPVLYRRQSKCNENPIFKDLNDGMDNFIDLEKTNDNTKEDIKNDNIVVETTLIDVHVDNNNRDTTTTVNSAPINPVLMNVSSSPLQPLKTHNFSNSSENNNKAQSIGSQQNTAEIDHLLNDFTTEVSNIQNNNETTNSVIKNANLTPTDNHDVKIFNFDRYEQNKLSNQFSRPLKKIDMAQLHSMENTRIAKDFFAQATMSRMEKKPDAPAKSSLPAIVNVYPNLTQTHLKVNENKKVFTNEQSTSSLSSDDSAALLQKQQLLRVAEWVEQNLEQHNNYNDPLEDEVRFSSMIARRDSKLSRLTETLNELALNMPHPVSKYSKPYAREGLTHNSWIHNNTAVTSKSDKPKQNAGNAKPMNNIAKETMFPVESDNATVTQVSDGAKNEVNNCDVDANHYNPSKEFREMANGDREITPEDLARMEYNVKKFLLSGPHWVTSDSSRRSRRTSSKTETDV